MFQESQAFHPQLMGDERSIESLRNRQKRLNTNVTKWIVVYKEAYSRKSRGMSDADVEKEAQKLYSKGKSTKFTHHEVFERIMRHYPKWELKLDAERHHIRVKYDDDADVEEDHGSSKKSRTTREEDDPNNSTLETHASEASIIRRLADRDEAKAKRKEKASQQSVIPDEYTVQLQAMWIAREKEMEAMSRMGNISLLNTLLGKSNLSPQEESLKNRLMVELFP
ncbi:hypothetical protein C2S51_034467 [Perilla frutescens var. frutescens]|nr:hypothetical protein C2S51_034467 [Perilla frutescens var. frutescens]